jgi:hypothetical protein
LQVVVAILILEEASDVIVRRVVGKFALIIFFILARRRSTLAAGAGCLGCRVVLNDGLLVSSGAWVCTTHRLLKRVSVGV